MNKHHIELADDQDTVLDLGAMVTTLWRGRWLFLLVTALFCLIGGLYAFVLAVPSYQASVTLVLDTRTEQVVDFESVVGSLRADSTAINTEVEVLSSRALLGQVVDKLDLVNDPEFNALLAPPTLRQKAAGGLVSLVSGSADPAEPPPSPQIIRERVIAVLAARVAVSNIPTSVVFEVTVRAGTPAKAALIANTLAELYVTNQIATKYQTTEQATLWLAGRATELQTELGTAETELKDFRATATITEKVALAESDQQLSRLRERVTAQTSKAAMTSARFERLAAAKTPQEKLAAASDAVLQGIFEATAPGGDETLKQANFDRRFNELLAVARQEADRDRIQLDSLRTSLTTLEESVRKQTEDLIRLDELTRKVDAVRLLYEYFQGRLRETSVQQGLQRADSRVLSAAVPPERPASPQKARIMAASLVLGGLVAIGFIFLRDMRRRVAVTAAELEMGVGYPVLGTVPLLQGRRTREMLSLLAGRPTSFAAESVRNLRTSLILRGASGAPKVIVVTSAMPNEGKTTLSAVLTQALAGIDRRVLLIDADLRRRTITRELVPADVKKGVHAMVLAQEWIDGIAYHDPDLDADMIPAEDSRISASDTLSSGGFERLLAAARERYDFIVVDAPPLLLLPDARLMAKFADAVLMAARWNKSNLPQVRAAARLLEKDAQAQLTGLVLTMANPKAIARYGDPEGYYASGRVMKTYFRE